MRNSTLATLALTAALGGGALLLGAPAASAMIASALSSTGIVESAQTASPVELVRHGRKHKYQPQRHGQRYRHRRGVHRHYYGGYWYSTPWWVLAPTYYYAPPIVRPPVLAGQCGYWHDLCVQNWGDRNANYYGCMRYQGCL